jgi:hypothetical protein
MVKPRITKNPLLSMMLSGAHAWAGAARGLLTGQVRRQQAAAMRGAARQVAGFWAPAPAGTQSRKQARKPRS